MNNLVMNVTYLQDQIEKHDQNHEERMTYSKTCCETFSNLSMMKKN